MALVKIRRLVFIIAAFALLVANVVPNAGACMPDSQLSMVATDGMGAPDCGDPPKEKAACNQAACIGSAVVDEIPEVAGPAQSSAYAVATVFWPDEFTSAPIKPPI